MSTLHKSFLHLVPIRKTRPCGHWRTRWKRYVMPRLPSAENQYNSRPVASPPPFFTVHENSTPVYVCTLSWAGKRYAHNLPLLVLQLNPPTNSFLQKTLTINHLITLEPSSLPYPGSTSPAPVACSLAIRQCLKDTNRNTHKRRNHTLTCST